MVNNPLGAFFRRGDDAARPQHIANSPYETGETKLSEGSLPDLRGFWNKIRGSSRSRGDGESRERLTKAQEENLQSLLNRYSLDSDGSDTTVHECDEENGDNHQTSSKDTKRKGSSSGNEDDEGCCSCFCTLTYWERLLGCLVFFVGGYVLEIGSLKRFNWLIRGHPLPFVALWTLGHIVSICGSLFMVGPKKQCQNMFIPVRAPATTAYLACLGLTMAIVIFCVIMDRHTGIVLSIVLVILLFVQCLCILWYTASCIPFLGKYLAKKMFGDKLVPDTVKKDSDGMLGFFRRKRKGYEEIPS